MCDKILLKMHRSATFIFVISFATVCYGCSISVNSDISDPQPLLLQTNGALGNEAFHLPIDSLGTIKTKKGEIIRLVCPGAAIKINGQTTGKSTLDAACVSGKKFKLNGITSEFKLINCTKQITQIVRYNGKKCLGTYKEIEMGFQVENGAFLNHMTICFDDKEQNSLYSTFNLTSSISGYQVNYARIDFKESTFYNLGTQKLDNLYNRDVQRVTINSLLGLNQSSLKYIHATDDYYLARGHLTAKTDFVYGSQQRLTFYFVNAAPQWQTANAANWQSCEDDARNYASANNLDLVIYSGTHGKATLPHEETGEETALYLFTDKYNAIPVPELYWKVVYEPDSKAGVALITLNNPYKSNFTKLCTDVCDKIDWLSWKATNQKSGYSYCCNVNDFRKSVPTLPKFVVNKLLI